MNDRRESQRTHAAASDPRRNSSDTRPELTPAYHHARDESRSAVRARPDRTIPLDERTAR